MFAFVYFTQVQRPVHESVLDLDLTLDALMFDSLHTSHLYAVQLNPSLAEYLKISTKFNGHTLDAKCPGVTAVKTADGLPAADLNVTWLQLKSKSKLSNETVRDTFSHFGTVERVMLPAKPGKHARHAYISE